MKIVKALAALIICSGTSLVQAQMINMGDAGHPQTNPANCNTIGVSGNNFQDQGGAGNYTPNYNGVITFCPDLTTGTKMSITMAINAGFTFDVDGSDFIYVYDGPDDTYPLLGTHNSVTDPTGFTHQATWGNPSGCLTIKFVTDGANEGTGWLANVQCGNPNEPFIPHLQAFVNGTGPDVINPADTGYVDICFGDSIMFVASSNFPYSSESTGYGYSQDVDNNIDFEWIVTDGNTYPNNDTIWFTPPARAGYLVDVKMTDMFPQTERVRCKVRVSQLPIFAGTGPLDSIICLGESTQLIGGVTAQDTVGVNVPPGTFNLGGNFAGLTYLPDGSGQQYTAPITISGFPDGATIGTAQDLNQVCITMEHSYLGDLEIWLECPSGLTVPLVNSYSPGFIPGGNSGGGTFLGHPYDDSGGGGAGEGWEYCFSSVFNTIPGSMTQNLGNTVPVAFVAGTPPLSAGNSIDPSDTYTPETTFANFAGCPVNGQWTIHVQDNLGIDDGWIFEWGLYFDASYFPGMGSYQNYIVNDFWSPDPTIISGMTDTVIVVQPNQTGTYSYTFNVVDDYGCPYDTTVSLFVQPLPTIFNDTIGCDMTFQVSGTTSVSGGTWSTTAPELSFLPNATNSNPTINTTTPGTYTVTFTDNACNFPVTADITYPPYPQIFADTALCNLNYQVQNTLAYTTGGTWSASSPNVSFSPAATTLNPLISASVSGNYTITFTDNVCNNTDQANITTIIPPDIFSDDIGCNLTYQVAGTVSDNGGVWSCADTAVHFAADEFEDNPTIWVSEAGTYTVTFTDNTCGISVSADVQFPPFAYTQVLDTTICVGSEYTINALEGPSVTNFVWSTGATGPSIVVTQPGDYIVTGSNICHSYSDTATIEVKICDIEAPNVISLSSTVGNNIWFVQYEGVQEFECTIVNRWGNKIYEYFDPAGHWDGRTLGGTIVEEGTYFYIIKAVFYGGQEVTKQGFIQVRY